MTNFEKLFANEMQNPEFVYHFERAKFERVIVEKLSSLEEKIKTEKLSVDAIVRMLDSFKLSVANSTYVN